MPNPLPVIAGAAQFNPRTAAMSAAPEPLAMMERVAREAAEDSHAPALLDSVDAIGVVNVMSARYRNAPDALARRLGLNPRIKIYTAVGGNSAQYIVNHFAAEIAAGKIRTAIVTGAEAINTARKSGGNPPWDNAQGQGEPETLGDTRIASTPYEIRYGARMPIECYPLFENARRAHRGWTLEEHRARMGRLWASMTKVAATNPYAWFPKERSAEEIATPSPDNRMICFPYTKLMNAIMDVDLAAAIILTSAQQARRAGVPADRMIYLHGAADGTDRWFFTERECFHRSPGLELCANGALEAAAIGTGAISFFDFYSCFPVAVEFALDALRLAEDDPRGVTVTGGLPYAGGPASNYVSHSIATMAMRLRENPGKLGMVTGLGWYFTKHSACVYGSRPPTDGFGRRVFPEPGGPAPVRLNDAPHGPAMIETYTVEHDRAEEPASAIVIGRLADGARFLSRAPREVLPAMEREEFIGRRGHVRIVDGINLFEPD